MTDKILPKTLVDKWIEEVMQYEYTITIHAKDQAFPEKMIRALQREQWSFKTQSDSKIIVTHNDPVALAALSIKIKKQGFLVEE
jgi:hypothetical protein